MLAAVHRAGVRRLGRVRSLAAVVLAGALVAGCGAEPGDPAGRAPTEPSSGPSSSSASAGPPGRTTGQAPSPPPSTAPAGPAYSTWELGAHPLPLRADGFGEVRRTPKTLRVRRYPTTDRLPPPADGRFHGTVDPVSPAVRQRMGDSWQPGCPVALRDLRYVTVSFRGFDRRAHTGELVLHRDVARDVVGVFRELFRADFPIEEMRLPTTADLEAHPTGDGNNTAATVCRAARGTSTPSAHALGLAVDVNPFMNPYQRDDLVLPELARAYLDRDWRRPGMIRRGEVVVRAFERIGWTWGGNFRTLHDYMHFSATGR
jgi:hypothetical protein